MLGNQPVSFDEPGPLPKDDVAHHHDRQQPAQPVHQEIHEMTVITEGTQPQANRDHEVEQQTLHAQGHRIFSPCLGKRWSSLIRTRQNNTLCMYCQSISSAIHLEFNQFVSSFSKSELLRVFNLHITIYSICFLDHINSLIPLLQQI